MKTPTAVLGVRGTVWTSVVKSDGSTTFATTRGAIDVTIGGITQRVPAGYSVVYDKKNKVFKAPVKITTTLLKTITADLATHDNAVKEKIAAELASLKAKEAADALAKAKLDLEKAVDKKAAQDLIDAAQKLADKTASEADDAANEYIEAEQGKVEDTFALDSNVVTETIKRASPS